MLNILNLIILFWNDVFKVNLKEAGEK